MARSVDEKEANDEIFQEKEKALKTIEDFLNDGTLSPAELEEFLAHKKRETQEITRKNKEKCNQEITEMKKNEEERKKDEIAKLNEMLDNKNVYNESSLRKAALEGIEETLRLFRESIGLKRLKEHNAEYFCENYNGTTNNRGYLYDVDGNKTLSLPSQIDTDYDKNLDGINDEKEALYLLQDYLRQAEVVFPDFRGWVDRDMLNENQLYGLACKKMTESVWRLSQAIALERNKKYNAEYFKEFYNGTCNENGYLYDKEGKITRKFPGNIDFQHKEDPKDAGSEAKKELQKYIAGITQG